MKIVAAIDGSANADRALAWAVRELDLRSAALTVLHAIHVPRLRGPLNREVAHDREHDAGADLVAAALDRIGADGRDLRVEVPLVGGGGGVAGAILHNTRDADLVVLGSRGLGGFPGLLLGSVSQQVAAHARVPVAVIPTVDDGQPADVTSVIVGVDGSTPSRQALAWGLEEARLRRVPAHALQVLAPSRSAFDDAGAEDEAGARAMLSSLVDEELGGRGDAVTRRVVVGRPAQVLMQEAATPTSLLVVGSRGRGGFAGLLLGSVSHQCLTHARGPVVIAHAS